MNNFELSEDLDKFIYKDIKYLIWYEDEELKIALSQIPDIGELVINKEVMTDEEIKSIKKKPFCLNNDVKVYLEDKIKDEIYNFEINSSYRFDGASIPKFARGIIGSKQDVRFKIASLIHDVLCENHGFVNNDRYFASCVFERCCYVGGTCAFIRFLMFHCVDNFQKFKDW